MMLNESMDNGPFGYWIIHKRNLTFGQIDDKEMFPVDDSRI